MAKREAGVRWLGVLAAVWVQMAGVQAAEEVQRVTVTSLAKTVFHPERDAPAEVVALQRSQVSSQVGAVVQEILVEVGSRVAKEQVLARQDCWDRQADAERAAAEVEVLKAEIGLARRQKERAVTLQKQGQSPQENLDRREAELQTLQARLHSGQIQWQAARLWLDKCVIRAPFAGVVVGRQAQVGEWAVPGTVLFDILDDQAVEVQARLEGSVDEGMLQAAKLEFVHNGTIYPLSLRVILPVADRTTRNREGRFLFTSRPTLAGSAGRLRWMDHRPHLPAWLLVRRQEKLGIFLAEEGVARFYPLSQAQEGRPVVWSQPTSQGQVILDGRERLQDGQKVTVQEEKNGTLGGQ
ncbi:MAG: efflux RND transporter periplasmic adaptor subunit [Magnetococcales bacterium]|nr:efflux RND transporter periplasmic adaptor subunit [Magnetococcales bacterium]NGZ25359.1 efflux RND transporter periplasmic adaptor subunit [Magnetococcales bacterium]